MFYVLTERNSYDGIFFFIYKLEYSFSFSDISFKMLESNPLYNQKKNMCENVIWSFSFVIL